MGKNIIIALGNTKELKQGKPTYESIVDNLINKQGGKIASNNHTAIEIELPYDKLVVFKHIGQSGSQNINTVMKYLNEKDYKPKGLMAYGEKWDTRHSVISVLENLDKKAFSSIQEVLDRGCESAWVNTGTDDEALRFYIELAHKYNRVIDFVGNVHTGQTTPNNVMMKAFIEASSNSGFNSEKIDKAIKTIEGSHYRASSGFVKMVHVDSIDPEICSEDAGDYYCR